MKTDETPRHTGRAIEDEIRIEAPPEVVWQSWAADHVPTWFVDRARGRMEPGERVEWYWEGEEKMVFDVLEADPPRRMLLNLLTPEGASLLEITIEQEGGHSVLRLVQSGFGEGDDWDALYEGMLSGWMIALAVLKHFAERYFDRKRTRHMVLGDAEFELDRLRELQRTGNGLSAWLASKAGTVGTGVGDPVQLVLADGRTLTGKILRQTRYETVFSWDEVDGIMELKAFRGPAWGSKVGIRVLSWLEDASDLEGLDGLLRTAVTTLVALL